MRILIQHTGTSHYLDAKRTWVSAPSKALAFANAIRAHDYIVYHRIEKATVVTEASQPPPGQPDGEVPATGGPLNLSAIGSLNTENENMKSKNTPLAKASSSTATAKAPTKTSVVAKPTAAAPAASAAPVAPAKKTAKKTQAPLAAKPLPVSNKAASLKPSVPAEPKPVANPVSTTKSEPAKTKVAAASTSKVLRVEASVDVGYGNSLFIRGQGAGLSWDSGIPLVCEDATRWIWNGTLGSEQVEFKLLINDAVWSKGENLVVPQTGSVVVAPEFE